MHVGAQDTAVSSCTPSPMSCDAVLNIDCWLSVWVQGGSFLKELLEGLELGVLPPEVLGRAQGTCSFSFTSD